MLTEPRLASAAASRNCSPHIEQGHLEATRLGPRAHEESTSPTLSADGRGPPHNPEQTP